MATQSLAKPPEPLNLEKRLHRGDNYITGSSSKETEACGKDRQRNQPSKGFHLIGKDGQDMFETFTLTELASSISSCGVTGAHVTD